MHATVASAIRWVAERSPSRVREEREQAIVEIERYAAEARASGATSRWLTGCDKQTRAVARDVNGPLLERLVEITRWTDAEAPELLRCGAPVVGTLPLSGLYAARSKKTHAASAKQLLHECGNRNRSLLNRLSEDQHSAELLAQMERDAAAGRMNQIVEARTLNLDEIILARRFAAVQGANKDGTPKVHRNSAEDDPPFNPAMR